MRLFWRIGALGLLAACAVLVLVSWPAGQQRSSGAPGLLILSPPPQAEFSSNYACFEIAANGLQRVSVQGPLGTITPGIRSGAVFFVLNVPIERGPNELVVSAVTELGSQLARRFVVKGKKNHKTPVLLQTQPEVIEGWPSTVTFIIERSLPERVIQILLDENGDGEFQPQALSYRFLVKYEEGITAMPGVILRTQSNLLYASVPRDQSGLRVVRPSVVEPSLGTVVQGASFVDLEPRPERQGYFALDVHQKRVVVLGADLGLVEEIVLDPSIGPTGIGADAEGNLYVADAEGHRVVRLLASAGYAPDLGVGPDGAFGSEGTGEGQFIKPMDVSVGGENGRERVFVTDYGNGRIQAFSASGEFELTFNLPGVSGGPLAARRITAFLRGGGLIVPDASRNQVHFFTSSGGLLTSFKHPGVVAIGQDPWSSGFVVSRDSGHGLALVSITGFEDNGSVMREIRAELRPLAAVGMWGETGHRLAVVDGSHRVHVVVLEEDAPAFTPRSVVTSFFQFIAGGGFDSARQLLEPRAAGGFDAMLEDPQGVQTLEGWANDFRDATIVRQSPHNSEVRAHLDVSVPATLGVLLSRDPQTLRWVITSF